MTLNIAFRPLALEPKTFSVGDTIRVTASFTYTAGEDSSVTVQAGPYHYLLGILDRIGVSFGSTEVLLPKVLTPTEKQFTIDFKLSGINAGTYGLIVEIAGTDWNATQDSVLVVTGGGGFDISSIMGLMMVVMMMGMIMPMMGGEEGEEGGLF
jgi:hypothetical protein